jgi:hypothetical protein
LQAASVSTPSASTPARAIVRREMDMGKGAGAGGWDEN